ncbi:MFS transporter [Streptomyces sp. RFCAC02]|uniref:MFS transporter n=1 Tax=Streptomyces sp. RFCAC02 TaxID=2499143 RepID=UPI001021E2E0|nr:MFS transporter [Streptomyces sp. RFCAC02]
MDGTRTRAVPALLVVAATGVALAQTVVVAALPVLQRELHTPADGAAWLLTAFMLASAVATPIAGAWGDLFGHRRVLAVCLACLACGSAVAALAVERGSFAGALTGRVLQGLSGGAFPMAFAIARRAVPAGRVTGLVAALSAAFGVGGALGLVVAGPVTDGPGTAALFLIVLCLAVAALAGTALLPPDGARAARSRAVDLPGAALLAATLVALLLLITEGGGGGHPWTVPALSAATVLGAAAFGLREVRTRHPLVDLRLQRGRALLTTNAATFVVGTAMFAAVTLLPRLVQTPGGTAAPGFGASAGEAGLVMIPVAALMLVTGPAAPRLAARTGPRVPLQAGAALAAVAFGMLAAAHGHLWQCYVAGGVLGAGYGLAFSSLGTLVVAAVPAARTGAATGVNTLLRTVSGAVGAQLSVTLLGSGAAPSEAAWVRAFLTFAGIALIGVAAASVIPGARAGRAPGGPAAPPAAADIGSGHADS